MTTIAFCGRYLAADQRHITGGSLHYSKCKIVASPYEPGVFFTSTGHAAWLDAWMRWARDGSDAQGNLPVTGLEGHQGSLMRFMDGVLEMLDFRLPYWTSVGKSWAWGSGADIAIGAMDWGANAMEAVKVAAGRDPNTGLPVDYLDITAPFKGVQHWGQI
jgi:hypothetical protein